jgi:cytochrome c peroxidase
MALVLATASLLACSGSTDSHTGGETEAQATQDLAALPAAQLRSVLHDGPFGLHPLGEEPIPQPIGGHIVNQAAAIRLGKAFFWDIQASGDGTIACGACHATWGSDARTFNTVNPGLDNVFGSSGVTGPNQTFHPHLITDDDIVGAQGVPFMNFQSVSDDPTVAADNCDPQEDPSFGFARQVNFRQPPMIYGAAFMRQLFWAGEASDQFNGATIWGFGPNGFGISFTHIDQAPLASQAVGPPGNFTEMTCLGRHQTGPTNSLAAKMLARQPLQHQRVSPTDSVLGALARPNAKGLWCGAQPCKYMDMIIEAYGPDMAADATRIWTTVWGEAVEAYEQTLIPDQTPFDKFFSGHLAALTPKQILGLATFVGRGNCVTCHAGPMMSDATLSFFQKNGAINRDGGDTGFHNIGILNSDFDKGRGDVGPAGAQFSISASPFDFYAFKTPTLRNIGHTAPYFHTGTKPTLEDVVDFYDRGGDFVNPQRSKDIKPLHLTRIEKDALVDFMKNTLSDCRVGNRSAPFDHPEIQVPNGVHIDATGAAGAGPCVN